MIITGLDTETTGLKWADEKNPDRLTEICMIPYRLPARKPILNFEQRVYSGKVVSKRAQEVAGITNADLIGKPTFKQIAPKVKLLIERSDLLVIHNAAFDIAFLATEMALAGVEMPDVAVFDTMTECMWASYDAKPPSLMELCWAMGVEYDKAKAHAARYDVMVMCQAFFAAVDRGLIEHEVFADMKEQAA